MSTLLRKLTAAIAVRWAELTDDQVADRGDSPVSTAVIVAIIAAGAIIVAGGIITVANGWVDLIPTTTAP